MSRFLVKSDLNATYTFKSTSAMQVKNQLKLNVIILKIQNTLLLLVTKDLKTLYLELLNTGQVAELTKIITRFCIDQVPRQTIDVP